MKTVPTSSSASPSRLPAGEYEVFLSFRGPDVRNNFADHLYTSLSRAKIRTFRDEEELRKGEGIAPSLVRAIPESKIYIPVLTQRYASSKWCLQELAQMVECWKGNKGHLILPIFYFVDPRDVRHQQGPYQQAFEQHAQKHSPETVKEWREALQEVGQMKGWHVTESDSQGGIIEQILSDVEFHLRSIYTLVTDELVGINSHVEGVMTLLNLASSEVKVVGIHGMGGLGKTTLAKAVYNKIFTQFDRCCFLEDVRETLTKSEGALSLQNKLISSILREGSYQVNNVSEGINMIKERVCKHKVLVVIDDIDDKFEFDKILGNLSDFSLDSRFMFTTRYKRALDYFRECKLYEPGEMSRPLSLQLFSKHAFGMDIPPKEDASISEEFVKVAAGLPLALTVIGSLLFRRGRKFWEEKLMELQGIPSTTENKVQERLKISYNELTRNEKEIFLDIACFFIGSHKNLPYYMWSGCDLYPESGIDTLIQRSLIKLDVGNHFWMHDHIKDLGRAIVKEEDIQHPYNRSRIWSTDDALDMFRNGKGSERVEAIRVNLNSRDAHEKLLTSKQFKNLSGLRYLEVRYGNVMGDFSQVLPNLRCLRLPHCESIPTDIYTTKLTVLDLEQCDVKDNWRGWNRIKAAAKLKAVNLTRCVELRRAPDLSTCAGMELINFEECGRMEGQLNIANFKNLNMLRLPWTKITGLIITGNDIGRLQRLEEMDLRFTPMTELPAGMDKLSSLQSLLLESLYQGYQLEIPRLPRSLKRLAIASSNGVPNLLELTALESLSYLNGSIPSIPRGLQFVVSCDECQLIHEKYSGPLSELPSLANLRNLTQLTLMHIEAVEIRGLGELRALVTMEISDSPNLNNLNGLENLLLLTTLSVGSCAVLERLPSLANLMKLKDLEVYQCPVLVEIQCLGDLGESLSRLTIKDCPSLANLHGLLQFLGALDDLTLEEQSFCGKPCPDLSGLLNLKRLRILFSPHWTEVTGLERLVSLESLTMKSCMSIRQLPDLSNLRNLNTLDLTNFASLTNVPTWIGRLESLRQLRVRHCWSITELPNLSGLKNLEELNLSYCTGLTEVKGIEGLESLTKLILYDCKSIEELGNVSGLKKLRELDIEGCKRLTKVKGLEELDGLRDVDMEMRMSLKYLAKAAARYGKELASRFVVGFTGAADSSTSSSGSEFVEREPEHELEEEREPKWERKNLYYSPRYC
ncbi:unnamed protein product [Linum tenue]|uniref:TIR domain-containing protein n=1 Tax=Linum tenue TaxID=586396 RepID=A0AAV0RMM6_9ROSI|nr:unnamed protein product [Linum tenue]